MRKPILLAFAAVVSAVLSVLDFLVIEFSSHPPFAVYESGVWTEYGALILGGVGAISGIVTGRTALEKVEKVSPPTPRGKPRLGNDELCTEGKTDQATGKVKQGAEKAVNKVDQVSPPMPRGKPGLGNDEFCTEGTNAGIAGIKVHMYVIASCGKKVGVVDAVEDGAIKLTKKDSPDDQHHFIPVGWVERVVGHVHLRKNSVETERDWKSAAAACVCSG